MTYFVCYLNYLNHLNISNIEIKLNKPMKKNYLY